MYIVSEYAITENPIYSIATQPSARFPWKIELRHKSGGKLKTWYYGANDFPCEKISWDRSEKGSLSAKMSFKKLNFPVYYGSELIISYNGKKKYRGFLSKLPDPAGDELEFKPYRDRLKQLTYNGSFSGQSFPSILQTILNDVDNNSGVLYNASLTKFDSTEVYSPVYTKEFVNKIIDGFYELQDDAYEGVDENGFQFVLEQESTVNTILYSGQGQPFQSIKIETDYSEVKRTYYNLFAKSTSAPGGKSYIGQIPNGSTYAYLELENIVGKIEENVTIQSGLNSTEGKQLYQAKLEAQRIPQNIKIKGLDITRYDLRIGEKVTIFTDLNYQYKTLIDCETLDNWTCNGTFGLSTDAVNGNYAIAWYSNNILYYDFGGINQYKNIDKITFMFKANGSGNLLSVNTGSTLYEASTGTGAYAGYSIGSYGLLNYSVGSTIASGGSTASSSTNFFANGTQIYYEGGNAWTLVEIESTNSFRYFGINQSSNSTITVACKIDDIRAYGYFQNSYTANVIKLNYDLTKENDKLYDVELGDYDPLANDRLFEMEKKIKELEAVQTT